MSTPDRGRLHWIGSLAERAAILGGYDRFMTCFENPDIVPQIVEGELAPVEAPSPLKRASWILNPASSHKYLAVLRIPPLQLVMPESWQFYSDLTEEGGVNDALWAFNTDAEESAVTAQQAAKKGFEIVRPILTTIDENDALGNPFKTPYYQDLLRHDYKEAVNGNARLYPSLLVMQKVVKHMCDNNFPQNEVLFGLAAVVGSVQAAQYIDANLATTEKKIRHRFYDGALIYGCDLLARTHQTVLGYLLSQKATAAFLESRQNHDVQLGGFNDFSSR